MDVKSLTEVAVGRFRRCGYRVGSVEQIAGVAGITKQGTCHHDSGKEELLERGLDSMLARVAAVGDKHGARADDPLDRLRYLIRQTVEIELATLDESAVFLQLRGRRMLSGGCCSDAASMTCALSR